MLYLSRDNFPWVGRIHLVSGKSGHDYLTEGPSQGLEILKKGSPSDRDWLPLLRTISAFPPELTR